MILLKPFQLLGRRGKCSKLLRLSLNIRKINEILFFFFVPCFGVCSVEGSLVLNDNRQGRDGDYFE